LRPQTGLELRSIKNLKLPIEPIESAKEAGLRYVADATPGLERKTRGTGFRYIRPGGKIIRDRNELIRIKRLTIPPAWTDVWICPSPNGHLQATGRDARRRKQYRYHSLWREVRDSTKYDRMIAFGKALPKIRKRVQGDLKLKDLPRDKVIAAVVRLLETTLIRIGNDEYARENSSYGLTTMRNRHAKVSGARATFEFYGKSHRRHVISVDDPALAKIVKRCRDLPGYELFQYVDQDGQRQKLHSDDVNQYLREITGEDFSAKDFRTWSGTLLAFLALKQFAKFTSTRRAKRNVVQAIEAVARLLGNTPAICRKCYVHPAIIDSYLNGSWFRAMGQGAKRKNAHAKLRAEELAVMALLHHVG
jgi:DNA topoisomerase-1